jgi:membrane protease YdiL (CAAX protease family)
MLAGFLTLQDGLLERLENRGIGPPSGPVTVPLLAIAGTEAAVFYGYVEYALWGYALTLLLCVLAPLRFPVDADVFRALSLLPVFRLVSLGMPVLFDSTLDWLLLVYGPFVPAAYLLAKALPSVDLSWGWLRALLALPVAVPASAGLGVVEYSIIEPTALIQAWTTDQLVFAGVVLFAFVALVEELLFRGIIQRALEARIGRWSGLLVSSLLFGLMHAGYGVHLELLFGALIGLLLGLVYDYVGSLALVVVMHGTLDVFLLVVVPYHPWLVSTLASALPG